jgi:hypothetical protein
MGTLKSAGIAGFLMEGGKMADLPCYFSNQVAEKTGAPNTGKLIAGDWSQVMLGIWSRSICYLTLMIQRLTPAAVC